MGGGCIPAYTTNGAATSARGLGGESLYLGGESRTLRRLGSGTSAPEVLPRAASLSSRCLMVFISNKSRTHWPKVASSLAMVALVDCVATTVVPNVAWHWFEMFVRVLTLA